MFPFSVGNEWRIPPAPYGAKNKYRMFPFSIGNEWRIPSAPYGAKNKYRMFPFSVRNEWRIPSAPYDARNNDILSCPIGPLNLHYFGILVARHPFLVAPGHRATASVEPCISRNCRFFRCRLIGRSGCSRSPDLPITIFPSDPQH